MLHFLTDNLDISSCWITSLMQTSMHLGSKGSGLAFSALAALASSVAVAKLGCVLWARSSSSSKYNDLVQIIGRHILKEEQQRKERKKVHYALSNNGQARPAQDIFMIWTLCTSVSWIALKTPLLPFVCFQPNEKTKKRRTLNKAERRLIERGSLLQPQSVLWFQ